jgi:hypothetical protein
MNVLRGASIEMIFIVPQQGVSHLTKILNESLSSVCSETEYWGFCEATTSGYSSVHKNYTRPVEEQ